MAVALCLIVIAVAVVLEIKLVAFLICGGVMAPSIAFSVLMGFSVGSKTSWVWGIIAAFAVFGLIHFLGRYQKIFPAITTMTACISSYFVVFFILSLAELLFDLGKFGSWTQAIACVLVAAFSVMQNLNDPGAGLLEGNEVICRAIASFMYGFTACFVSAIFLDKCSYAASVVIVTFVCIVGTVAAYFIDCALSKQAAE